MEFKTIKKGNLRIRGLIFRSYILHILLILVIFWIYFVWAVTMYPPKVDDDMSILKEKRTKYGENFYGIKNNRIRKSESGLWEMYIEGKPFERGVYMGKLSKELMLKQEDAFVDEIKKMIPSESYLKFMKYFTAWFNQDMDEMIQHENLVEIYGESLSASNTYNYIGSNYQRILNYHGAHDIGHAMQDLAMVGCTSFATWDTLSADSSLIIGRNFDFYVGDKFAEDKIVAFYNPSEGYKFAMITWGGFTGVASGMNEQGLTITLNAARSEIPFSAKTPISLVAREILQYAKNIDEAYKIAEKRQTFVAEALMVGSANDNKTAIIEKTPYKTVLFSVKGNKIIGPNHFQSKEFWNTPLNQANIKESSSMYRFKRMTELLEENYPIDFTKTAKILRNQKGLGGKDIGMTNEKNICQLISHHAIIFKPLELKFWVSTTDFQLGKFVCYDLKKVFSEFPKMTENHEIYEPELTIPADSFIYSEDYKKSKIFRKLTKVIKIEIKQKSQTIDNELISEFINSNPEYFYVYSLAGDYYFSRNKNKKAKELYKIALTKEVTTIPEKNHIEKQILKIESAKKNNLNQ